MAAEVALRFFGNDYPYRSGGGGYRADFADEEPVFCKNPGRVFRRMISVMMESRTVVVGRASGGRLFAQFDVFVILGNYERASGTDYLEQDAHGSVKIKDVVI